MCVRFLFIFLFISQIYMYVNIYTAKCCFSMQCEVFWKFVSTCMDSYIHKCSNVYFYMRTYVTKSAVFRAAAWVCYCAWMGCTWCFEPALFSQRHTSIVHNIYVNMYMYKWPGYVMQLDRQNEFETEQCKRLKLVRLPEIYLTC